MENLRYGLMRGWKRVGDFYTTFEEAKELINDKGIWNICLISTDENGIHKVVDRTTVVHH